VVKEKGERKGKKSSLFCVNKGKLHWQVLFCWIVQL